MLDSIHLARRERILAFQVNGAAGHHPFIENLARLHDWDIAFAKGAYQEYLRFCYLCTQQRLSPSYLVDQVWHVHLTYTHDYWERFCPEVLGMPLHHVPSDGTTANALHLREQYAQTLRLYETEFGAIPSEYWPNLIEQHRGANGLRVINRMRVWMLPRW